MMIDLNPCLRMRAMKPKKEKNNLSKKKVTFKFYGPDAKEVALLGDFNQWRPDKHPMKMDADGVWQKSIFVVPGTYEYKFQVDGDWENDPENPMMRENSYGTKNNFIVVGKK